MKKKLSEILDNLIDEDFENSEKFFEAANMPLSKSREANKLIAKAEKELKAIKRKYCTMIMDLFVSVIEKSSTDVLEAILSKEGLSVNGLLGIVKEKAGLNH